VIKLFSLYSRETSYTNTTFNFQDRSKKLKLKHGKVPVGNITVDMVWILMFFVITQRLYLLNILVYIVLHVVFVKVLGGMRGMTGLHNRNLIA